MEKRISATQAVREFSEILNSIKFKGTHYIIERSGKPVAQMKPVDDISIKKRLKDLSALLEKLPRLDEELNAYASDLDEILNNQPPLTAEDPWA